MGNYGLTGTKFQVEVTKNFGDGGDNCKMCKKCACSQVIRYGQNGKFDAVYIFPQ